MLKIWLRHNKPCLTIRQITNLVITIIVSKYSWQRLFLKSFTNASVLYHSLLRSHSWSWTSPFEFTVHTCCIACTFLCFLSCRCKTMRHFSKFRWIKGGELRDAKNPQLVAQHCFVASFCRCFPFFTLCDQPATKTFVAGWRKLLRKVERGLLVFHQTHNLSCNKFVRALANQPISAPHFFNPQQMFLLRVKLIKQGEKRETSTKTCNGTMLRDKLRVFVSRISPPRKLIFSFFLLFSQSKLLKHNKQGPKFAVQQSPLISRL